MTRYYLSVAAIALIIACGVCQKSVAAHVTDASTFAQVETNRGPAENPVAPETNPPGDIPDSQVFVKYASPTGAYELQVPEGWARLTNGMDVTFTSKLDGLSLNVSNAPKPPSADSIGGNQAQSLKETGRAVTIKRIEDVMVSGRPAVLMVYECNSEPNPVTNKQMRLENDAFFFYQNGKLATLRLWAPLGADNVDQWKLISESFRWR